MNLPLRLLRRVPASHAALAGALLASLATVIAVSALISLVEGGQLRSAGSNALSDPAGMLVALSAFAMAFALRAAAWCRTLPGLTFGHSMAAIHVALGANHILPFRLGEPLRVISVVRRTRIGAIDATVSGALLRVADIVALLVIGLALGPQILLDTLGVVGLGIGFGVLAGGAVLLVAARRRAAKGSSLRSLTPEVAAAALIAWGAEAVAVQQVAQWAGADLSYQDALLVTVLAVAAQLVAVAPGGVGTYEAAAVAGLVVVGVDPATALTVAVSAHVFKTLYSLTTGVIAMYIPAPTLAGRFRVPASIDPAPKGLVTQGPVVLFLPAYNEGPRIASVLARAPRQVLGRPVHLLVIDDGSTDDTSSAAAEAGAEVITLDQNQGLGAAVARGLQEASLRGAAAVAFCDADGEYDPAQLERLVDPILAGTADYVVGSRFGGTIHHMEPHRRFGNKTLTRWVRWMTRRPVTDGQSGYRALSQRAAAAAEMAHDYNYAQVLTLDLILKGYGYMEVPIDYRFRESGDSFVKLGRYLTKVVPATWSVLNRPTTASDPAESAIASAGLQSSTT